MILLISCILVLTGCCNNKDMPQTEQLSFIKQIHIDGAHGTLTDGHFEKGFTFSDDKIELTYVGSTYKSLLFDLRCKADTKMYKPLFTFCILNETGDVISTEKEALMLLLPNRTYRVKIDTSVYNRFNFSYDSEEGDYVAGPKGSAITLQDDIKYQIGIDNFITLYRKNSKRMQIDTSLETDSSILIDEIAADVVVKQFLLSDLETDSLETYENSDFSCVGVMK